MDYSAIKQLLDAVDDKDKVKIGIELAKWLAGKGWELLTNREKKSTAKAAESVIQLATMDDIREFSPTYQAVLRYTSPAPRAGSVTAKKAAKKGMAFKRAPVKKAAPKKMFTGRSAAKKVAAKRRG